MKLVIFDLDQTLVDLISIHNEVTHKLFKKEFNVDARLTDIDFAGKSLHDNFKELAERKNVPEETFNARKDELLEKYEKIFEDALPSEGSGYVLAGVRELLAGLTGASHFIVLYTGGSRKIGESVLRITGLGKYFRMRFYGTEVYTRKEMVGMAIEQAEKVNDRRFLGRDVIVIGDSIRDVDCGKAFNAFTIGVATGFHSRTELIKRGADLVVDNFDKWPEIVRIIGSTR